LTKHETGREKNHLPFRSEERSLVGFFRSVDGRVRRVDSNPGPGPGPGPCPFPCLGPDPGQGSDPGPGPGPSSGPGPGPGTKIFDMMNYS